jgi:hypothetical protein
MIYVDQHRYPVSREEVLIVKEELTLEELQELAEVAERAEVAASELRAAIVE